MLQLMCMVGLKPNFTNSMYPYTTLSQFLLNPIFGCVIIIVVLTVCIHAPKYFGRNSFNDTQFWEKVLKIPRLLAVLQMFIF